MSNGQVSAQTGELKTVTGQDNQPTQVVVVYGAYTFVGPDGQTYWVNYYADDTGFHPIVGMYHMQWVYDYSIFSRDYVIIIGTGPGGIKPGDNQGVDPNALKALIG